MKRIEAKDQVRLSLYRCFEVCINGIYYRFFRSMVTASIVVLTVAFFSNVVIEGLMTNGVARGVRREMRYMRRDAIFLAKITETETLVEFLDRLARTNPDSRDYKEILQVTGAPRDKVDRLIAFSRLRLDFQKFFDQTLTYGKRRVLVHGKTGLEVFEYLQDPQHYAEFENRLKELRSLRLPHSLEEFRRFLAEYPDRIREVKELRVPYQRAVQAVVSRWPLPELKRRIIKRDPDVPAFVRSLGFILTDDECPDIARQLDRTEKILAMVQSFQNFTFKTRFINRYSILAKQYTPMRVMKKLRKRSGARWYVEQAASIPLPVRFSEDEVRDLAKEFLSRATLREVERLLTMKGDWSAGLDRKTIWLIIVSFVVCAVGIANAMLISVAERFREIATMKCLGALDGFIMTLFVMEASLFGLAGGILGVVLGLLLSLVRQFMSFGRYAFLYFPGTHVVAAVGLALLVGMTIATIAALYPSWVASRMAPMEAMRVE